MVDMTDNRSLLREAHTFAHADGPIADPAAARGLVERLAGALEAEQDARWEWGYAVGGDMGCIMVGWDRFPTAESAEARMNADRGDVLVRRGLGTKWEPYVPPLPTLPTAIGALIRWRATGVIFEQKTPGVWAVPGQTSTLSTTELQESIDLSRIPGFDVLYDGASA